MMRLLAVCAAASLFGSAAVAKDVPFMVTSVVKDKPTVSLDPAMGHVLLRSGVAMPLMFMRVPSAEDQARYDGMRAEGLAKAKRKYAEKMKNYDRDLKTYDRMKKAGQTWSKPEKPVEPTEENFEFTAFGMMSNFSIGPLNRFSKGGPVGSVYLQSVTPGTYRAYGMIMLGSNGGMSGLCFCMGSIQFDVAPGEVTDLGLVNMGSAMMPGNPDDLSTAEAGGFTWIPGSSSMSVDSRLSGYTVKPAKFRPIGKLPNYFGIAIDRMPAIKGVMRYDRDRIVDLTVD